VLLTAEAIVSRVERARFVELMSHLALLTLSTTTNTRPRRRSAARPLQRFGVPANELSMVGLIALRFVPILAEELDRIARAQISRGADFGSGGAGGLVKRTRRLVPLVVPLFISSFRRAEELIVAMDSRCYRGGRGRTRYRTSHFPRSPMGSSSCSPWPAPS